MQRTTNLKGQHFVFNIVKINVFKVTGSLTIENQVCRTMHDGLVEFPVNNAACFLHQFKRR